MSVQTNQYVMVGVQLPFRTKFAQKPEDISEEDWNQEDAEYELLDPYMDSAFKGIHHYNGLCVISDGMNGEYTMIGRVLEKSEVGQFLDGVFCLSDEQKLIVDITKELIEAQFGIEDPDVKIMFFTHYR